MTHNPLFLRLTRNARWPSFRLTFWLAFGLGLVSLAVSCWTFLRLPSTRALSIGLLLAPLLLYLITPLIVASAAAAMIARDTGNEQYKLLRLTELSPASVVHGYVLAVLHRLRILLALLVGLMPALVVGVLYLWVELEAIIAQSVHFNNCWICSLNVLSVFILFPLAEVAASWASNLFAVSLGAWLTFLFRSPRSAVILTLPATLLAMLGHTAAVLLTVKVLGEATWATVTLYTLPIIILPPYGLTILFLDLARRRVERTPEK